MSIVEDALALMRAPDRLHAARRQALPADLRPLLRIVAGDAEAIAAAAQRAGEPPAVVREAAALYVQQVLFAADEGDSYRVLGVPPDASDARIKEHYRLLARWLHPDRNGDGWEGVYVYRINAAWQDLRSAERRRRFDRRRAGAPGIAPSATVRASRRPARSPFDAAPMVAARAMAPFRRRRHLSAWILGSLGAAALALLAVLYSLQPAAKKPRAEAVASVPIEHETPQSPVIAGTIEAAESQSATPAAIDAMPATQTPRRQTVEERIPIREASPVATVQSEPAFASDETPSPAIATVAVAEPSPPAPMQARPAVASTVALVAPAQASIPAAVAPSPSLIDEARAQALIRHFVHAYEAGDLERLSYLVTRDLGSHDKGRNAILREYRRLFRSSEHRRLRISAVSWIEQADTAIIIASFDASILSRGERAARQVSGDIRFDLRREDGDLRIYRLRHERHGG